MVEGQWVSRDDRRRFRTGRVGIDFVHTGGEGEFAVWEMLHEPADVTRVLGGLLGTELRVEGSDLAEVRTLRAAIDRTARRAARGEPPAVADVDVVNAAAAHPSLAPRLTGDGTVALQPGTTRQALSTLARDVVDLLASPLAARIRVCAADDCELLFVDASRPGRRRWCSMQRCGDRAKKVNARGPRRTT